jgi:hypothetical protein
MACACPSARTQAASARRVWSADLTTARQLQFIEQPRHQTRCAMAENDFTWDDEDAYWRTNYRDRPYGQSAEYERYRPGYRFGFESARRYHGRDWDDVEPELQRNWDSYEYREGSTWDQMKEAVRDAWNRMTGRHPVESR